MQELLGALSAAWPRLVIYPGGLTALTLCWLIQRVRRGERRGSIRAKAVLLAVAMQLVAISLLPLPYAVPFPYGLDLLVALALLDGPLWLADEPARNRKPWGYGLLLLAGLALIEGSGSLRLDSLLGWHSRPEVADRVLLLVGSGGWLAGALWAGRWLPYGAGATLRLVGHGMIASLPWLGALLGAG